MFSKVFNENIMVIAHGISSVFITNVEQEFAHRVYGSQGIRNE